MSDVKRILCFGDSLTWGWVPMLEGVPTTRYPFEQRWTGAFAKALGTGYEIIEEGLNARTTTVDDPGDSRLNGSAYLPTALASHLPLDLVILMLGTNDCKIYFDRTPLEIANGITHLLKQIKTSAGGVGSIYPAPKALLMSPPALSEIPNPWLNAIFEKGHAKAEALPPLYEAAASFMKSHFMRAGDFVKTEGVDGIHLTPENNEALGKAGSSKSTRNLVSRWSEGWC